LTANSHPPAAAWQGDRATPAKPAVDTSHFEAEITRLKDELLAASTERDQALVEAADTRRQIDALRYALDEQALRGAGRDDSMSTDDVSAMGSEQLGTERSYDELAARHTTAQEEIKRLRTQLEQSRHAEEKLRLALSAQGPSGASEDDDDMAVTELQLALVEAKMQLATMEFEREEVGAHSPPPILAPAHPACAAHARSPWVRPMVRAPQAIHKVKMVTQQLEDETANHHRVSKEMTWLEVKYSDARSELVQLQHHNQSLQEDVKEMIAIKLELAEARARIEELERQNR